MNLTKGTTFALVRICFGEEISSSSILNTSQMFSCVRATLHRFASATTFVREGDKEETFVTPKKNPFFLLPIKATPAARLGTQSRGFSLRSAPTPEEEQHRLVLPATCCIRGDVQCVC
jgi:hypothetical protein